MLPIPDIKHNYLMKIGVFYGGSRNGSTAKVAEKIAEAFKPADAEVLNLAEADLESHEQFDVLIMGTSAWGIGGYHTDWDKFIDKLGEAGIESKKVAFFGLGDQKNYPESFVDGMGTLFCRFPYKENVLGFTSTEGYKYYFSAAERDGKFVGLAIDDDFQPELTDKRIDDWVKQLKKDLRSK